MEQSNAMSKTKITLSEELQEQIEQIARDQNREPVDVLNEAVRRYVGVQQLERLAHQGGKPARKPAIPEKDVTRLVDQVRRENRDRLG
jgi:predicted transcriptional regulator